MRFLAPKFILIGRSILQPNADELRAVDRRNPIIFLRSFHDDELKVKGRDGYSRLEEIISKQLPLFGPLIAIGKPGERLPTLGAARNYYVSDSEWRAAVLDWLEQARLIVVFAGLSKGLEWEIESISQRGYLSKLLVLMPQSNQPRRWAHLRQAMAQLPQFANLPDKMPKGVLCVHGVANGELVVITSSGMRLENYIRALHYAIYGMFRAKYASSDAAHQRAP